MLIPAQGFDLLTQPFRLWLTMQDAVFCRCLLRLAALQPLASLPQIDDFSQVPVLRMNVLRQCGFAVSLRRAPWQMRCREKSTTHHAPIMPGVRKDSFDGF